MDAPGINDMYTRGRVEAEVKDAFDQAAIAWAKEHDPASREPVLKETNPKDAVGVRKVPFSVLPSQVLAEAGLGLLEGARKYGRHNYRTVGIRASVYYDAQRRHMDAWWEGQDIDPESGLSHVTKAICSLLVLRDAMMNGKVEDDRPPAVDEKIWAELNELAGEIIDRHPNPKAAHVRAKS